MTPDEQAMALLRAAPKGLNAEQLLCTGLTIHKVHTMLGRMRKSHGIVRRDKTAKWYSSQAMMDAHIRELQQVQLKRHRGAPLKGWAPFLNKDAQTVYPEGYAHIICPSTQAGYRTSTHIDADNL